VTDLTCDQFDLHVEELALGHLDEPQRGQLLAHAAACPACQTQLDALAGLSDQLLVLTPEHDPPAGFEQRVLERLRPSVRVDGPPPARRHRWLAAAAAAVVLGVGAGGWAVGHQSGARSASAPAVARSSGAITTAGGARVGMVRLVGGAQPYVLVTLDHPQPGSTEVYCELVSPSGAAVRVGSWSYEDVAASVWAVGIDPDLLDAVAMNVVTEDGTVVAAATLT
jgi:hypothetical protein